MVGTNLERVEGMVDWLPGGTLVHICPALSCFRFCFPSSLLFFLHISARLLPERSYSLLSSLVVPCSRQACMTALVSLSLVSPSRFLPVMSCSCLHVPGHIDLLSLTYVATWPDLLEAGLTLRLCCRAKVVTQLAFRPLASNWHLESPAAFPPEVEPTR